MAKVINLFNHKGGVSKTTTVFNLGWMLAERGHRVVMADFDPQCNLTGMVLGYQGIDDLQGAFRADPPNNIKDALAPAFESKPQRIVGAECYQVNGNDRLFLLPGHIGLAEYDTTLGIAQELSGSLLALRNLPGSLRFALDQTADKYAADYVLVDMSPSLSPINQNLLMTGDHFIVPLHPDYFSSMALSSLSRTLPRWRQWAATAHSIPTLRDADYPFPAPSCTFIGAIVQKYRPRGGNATAAFQSWIDQLIRGLQEDLVPALTAAGMLDVADFTNRAGHPPSTPLVEMSDFNSLIAFSQEHQVPVYRLTADLVQREGAIWDRMEASMDVFRHAFENCAIKIEALTA